MCMRISKKNLFDFLKTYIESFIPLLSFLTNVSMILYWFLYLIYKFKHELAFISIQVSALVT